MKNLELRTLNIPCPLVAGIDLKFNYFWYSRCYVTECALNILYICGRRGIAPTRNCTHLLKKVLNLFVCIKPNFLSYNFPFFIWFIPLVDIIGIKPAPATTNPILRKWVQFRVGATTWTYICTRDSDRSNCKKCFLVHKHSFSKVSLNMESYYMKRCW